jgi:hypothetical protein
LPCRKTRWARSSAVNSTSSKTDLPGRKSRRRGPSAAFSACHFTEGKKAQAAGGFCPNPKSTSSATPKSSYPIWPAGGANGGWWILPEPEIHFVRDTEVVVPDLAGWRRERMPAMPRDHRFEVVPDWVCEILSPSTAQKDRTLKLPLYARYCVAHAWLVDPLAHTLEAFELRDSQWVLLGAIREDDAVCFPPFAAVSFSLADRWV